MEKQSKEEILLKRKEAYRANAEKNRERARAYYAAHIEERRAYDRERYDEKLEKSREWRRQHYIKNKERLQEYGKQYRSSEEGRRVIKQREINNPEKLWAKRRRCLLLRYGVDPDWYEIMVESQGGVCAICLLPESKIDKRSGKPRMLAVDHDHTTGANRGLLCGACNLSLGAFADNPERLIRAAAYVEAYLS